MSMVELPRPERTDAQYFDLDQARGALASGLPVAWPPMEIVHTVIDGQVVIFACNMERDPIQAAHRKGAFYEAEDLARIRALLPQAPRVLDVGANVGNHALFFALTGAARVVVVEPNPLALAPLMANVVLNRQTDIIDTAALGIGLGAASEGGFSMKRHDRNLGATKMRRGSGGGLEVHAGDDLFGHEVFDLIKIDVEGMEMEVLEGLDQTIARCRPVLFVEVDDAHQDAIRDWAAVRGYVFADRFVHGRGNANFLMTPPDKPRSAP